MVREGWQAVKFAADCNVYFTKSNVEITSWLAAAGAVPRALATGTMAEVLGVLQRGVCGLSPGWVMGAGC